MPKKMGRPPLAKKEYRGRIYAARLKSEEEKLVKEAVRKSGKSQSDWIREALLKVARASR